MNFEGTINVDASPARVWAYVLDAGNIAACMPGVEQITPIDGRTFRGVIRASVGPIVGSFDFGAHIVESDPPHALRAEVEGTDSVTSSTVRTVMTMTLAPDGEQATALAYHASVEVHGRLAILGDMVLRATASLLVEEFGRRLRSALDCSDQEGEARAGSL